MPPPERDARDDALQRDLFAKPQRAEHYVAMSLAFMRTAVLRAGLELRIFDHMAKGPPTPRPSPPPQGPTHGPPGSSLKVSSLCRH